MERSEVEEEEEQFNPNSSCCSDSESVIDGPISKKLGDESSACSGLCALDEDAEECVLLKHKFSLSIGSLSRHCSVVSAYRNFHRCTMGKARLVAFRMFLKAMAEKNGGDPNVAHGWFGTSKDGAFRIMKDGFGVCGIPTDRPFGSGLHLYSDRTSADSVLSAPVDEDGLRHLVVCRVILGSTEELLPGSVQCGPGSEEHDSGVDNKRSPSKYIIWFPNVRTHVLPLYMLSVKLDFTSGGLLREPMKRPTSPWMPFGVLISALSKCLPSSTMRLIRRFHSDFTEKKITRQQLIFEVRQLTGDKILISAIKNYRAKSAASQRENK